MSLDYQIREKCVITGEADLESLCTIKDFPIFIGCTEQPKYKDIKKELDVVISQSSGIIQLRKLLPRYVIYPAFHSEAVGKVWEDHFNYFSNFILKHRSSNIILEMGGSNARLAQLCVNKQHNLIWTIVEPNPGPLYQALASNIKIIKSFIEDQQDLLSGGATFVHSHVLEHLYEPVTTLKSITKRSKRGDKMIFSVPNLYKYLKNNFVNTINFEHTYFLTENVLDFLMDKLGYQIVEKQYYQEHSIFYAVEYIGHSNKIIKKSGLNYYFEYKKLYLEFIQNIANEVVKLNTVIKNYVHEEKSKDARVFIFGAHIFSQFLINFGLKTNNIEGIIDNSKNKIGKRLYGTDLNVMSPDVLRNDKKALVILKAGQYQSEIEDQLRQISKQVTIVS